MAEPATTIALFSLAKGWSILASVCGSLTPILALSDKRRPSFQQAIFMALSGCSFSIFMGPWLALYFGFQSIDAVVALSWFLGVVGVYIIRAGLQWIENRGEQLFDNMFSKVTGTQGTTARTDDRGYQTEDIYDDHVSPNGKRRIRRSDGSGYFDDRRGNPPERSYPNDRRSPYLPPVTTDEDSMSEDTNGDHNA